MPRELTRKQAILMMLAGITGIAGSEGLSRRTNQILEDIRSQPEQDKYWKAKETVKEQKTRIDAIKETIKTTHEKEINKSSENRSKAQSYLAVYDATNPKMNGLRKAYFSNHWTSKILGSAGVAGFIVAGGNLLVTGARKFREYAINRKNKEQSETQGESQ